MWKMPIIEHNKPTEWGWVVAYPESLSLGDETDIGFGTYIQAQNGVKIGHKTQIGSHCAIYSRDTEGDRSGTVNIGNNVRIGANTVIMPGVTIEEEAVIGACSFIPHNTIVASGIWAGVPISRKRKIWAITGGAGTLGKAITRELIKRPDVDQIRIISRDEVKHANMKHEFKDGRLRFIIGDVRDRWKMERVLSDVTYVIHCAAMKRVEVCGYNEDEAVMTNIIGTLNVRDAALSCGVRKALLVSSDKAADPVSTYGRTKLEAEKIWLRDQSGKTGFYAIRLGNIMCSTGSVIPAIKNAMVSGTVTISDMNATRFFMTPFVAARACIDTILRFARGLHTTSGCRSASLAMLLEACSVEGGKQCKIIETCLGPEEKKHESFYSMSECEAMGITPNPSDKAIMWTVDELRMAIDELEIEP